MLVTGRIVIIAKKLKRMRSLFFSDVSPLLDRRVSIAECRCIWYDVYAHISSRNRIRRNLFDQLIAKPTSKLRQRLVQKKKQQQQQPKPNVDGAYTYACNSKLSISMTSLFSYKKINLSVNYKNLFSQHRLPKN